VTDPSLPFFTRLWFAWVCLFRIWSDGGFAARVQALSEGSEAPALAAVEPPQQLPTTREAAPAPPVANVDAALQLLGLLQREGRFIDFVQQDIQAYPDQDIGAAARVVHAGCRKALLAHATLSAVRSEQEGARVVLETGFEAGSVKLTGNVGGAAPYSGTLRHRGWRVERLELPQRVGGNDPRIVAPAEVEL
jgi:hypothetical protein